jgi:hypothetical protein
LDTPRHTPVGAAVTSPDIKSDITTGFNTSISIVNIHSHVKQSDINPDNCGAAQALPHMNFDGTVASPDINFGTGECHD